VEKLRLGKITLDPVFFPVSGFRFPLYVNNCIKGELLINLTVDYTVSDQIKY